MKRNFDDVSCAAKHGTAGGRTRSDDTQPLPRWLEIHDLDDLKNHLVSIVIAVLAVLFLREPVARAGDVDLLQLGVIQLGAALALMIAALIFYLTMKEVRNK
ncbi:MAG TPA: YqhA family protein [Xanthobacteraceae bacterium]|nr:YqhA family protein [Xanthobacteraceae bacterium]